MDNGLTFNVFTDSSLFVFKGIKTSFCDESIF